MRLIIVGGVAGGASAATRARRLNEHAEIVLFERGPDVSFANCGMPYFIGGKIGHRAKMLVTTAERLAERFRLDVRTGSLVESIDRAAREVVVRKVDTGETYRVAYDKLILAPGAAPLRPPLPGIDLPGILTLRNLGDMDRIHAVVQSGIRRAVVVGAGFIGLEMVENLVLRGIATTLVELQDQILPPLDREMTPPITERLRSAGIDVRLSESVTGFATKEGGIEVQLKSGERLDAQLVVLGIGVRPEDQLAVDAGLDVGPRGGIRVDRYLRTSDPAIFAVGDAIEVEDYVLGGATRIPLAGPANRQGRLAAENALGGSVPYRGSQGTAVVGVLGMTAAMTGASEKTLRRVGRAFRKIHIHPAHHAGYYPGAEPMSIKVLFDPESGAILGAQAVGGAGVDKRIDVLAVAVQARLTVFDLEQMELAYAPQFGSAKDPVNMAGFVGAGLLRGEHPQVDAESLVDGPTAGGRLVLDVRTDREFAAGHIPGAVHIPVDALRSRIDEVPVDREVTVYCQVGMRGYLATRILRQYGRNASNVGGGFTTYQRLRGIA
ncbi:MAG: CoA-disulfide reductase [Planctomycetes bacterium]|nr:CoA-disulfide reductase [Planctomycetota bacterium]